MTYPKHPIVLSCLAESISKVFGGIDPQVAAGFFSGVKNGTRRSKVLTRDVGNLLPTGISGEDWGDAICAVLNTGWKNDAYCHLMGNGDTTCNDFVRLALPLKKGKSCLTSDLVPLFRHLWMNPYLGANWDAEMQMLHAEYVKFIERRTWLSKALDPGFVVIENGPAPGVLAGWIKAVPTQGCGGKSRDCSCWTRWTRRCSHSIHSHASLEGRNVSIEISTVASKHQ